MKKLATFLLSSLLILTSCEDEIIDQLKGMFGDMWVPIFKKWFTDTFSLPVKTVEF